MVIVNILKAIFSHWTALLWLALDVASFSIKMNSLEINNRKLIMIKQLAREWCAMARVWSGLNELCILLIHKLPHEHTNYLNWILPIIWSQSSAFTQQIDEMLKYRNSFGSSSSSTAPLQLSDVFHKKKSTASQRERECKNTNSY